MAEVEVEQRGQGGHHRGEAGHAPSPELRLRHVQGLQPTEARPGEELQRAGLDSDRGVGRGDGEHAPTWLSLALAILILLHSQGLLPTWYKYLKEQNIIIHYTVSFSKDVFSQGPEYQVFLGVFLMFLAFFHSKIWAKFHFGTFEP